MDSNPVNSASKIRRAMAMISMALLKGIIIFSFLRCFLPTVLVAVEEVVEASVSAHFYFEN